MHHGHEHHDHEHHDDARDSEGAARGPSAHGHHATEGWRGAASVTLHCLTGCAIGEWLGLALGVSLHWPVARTIVVAVALAFLFGYLLTLVPLLRSGVKLGLALKIVWLGETVSIAVMELVMNVIDYAMGGMQPGMSLLSMQYWAAFAVAAAAGFVAAWPINYWMLARKLRKTH
jgi:Domain of unknown function (DUF4396)